MLNEKLKNLIATLKEMGSVLLAYSGGVDSTFLLKAVKLSGIRALAITSNSETTPYWDLKTASLMALEFGIHHRLIKTGELENEDFLRNTKKRCFYCKDELFRDLKELASYEGFNFIIDGSNLDDTKDYRPGREAGMKWGIRSPLIEVGFSKEDIREASKKLGLSTWNKPSSPCLASRFPYGMRITSKGLQMVASSEVFLKEMGFSELRVRHYGDKANIELRRDEIDKLLMTELRDKVTKMLKVFGYRFISIDPEGFRSGRMNEGVGCMKVLVEENSL